LICLRVYHLLPMCRDEKGAGSYVPSASHEPGSRERNSFSFPRSLVGRADLHLPSLAQVVAHPSNHAVLACGGPGSGAQASLKRRQTRLLWHCSYRKSCSVLLQCPRSQFLLGPPLAWLGHMQPTKHALSEALRCANHIVFFCVF
jgi:hypothetical protein